MITERYSVAFFGLDTKYYSEQYVAHEWEVSANKEYLVSDIYITCRITTELLVSGRIRADLKDTVFVITSVRNPSETESKEDYWNAYRRVINEVRTSLHNPYMAIAVDSVDYYYFTQV